MPSDARALSSTAYPPGAEILLDRFAIDRRNREMAQKLVLRFREQNSVPLFVGVLKGSFVFLADLVRCYNAPCEVDFLGVRSYGSGTVSSGAPDLYKDISHDIAGRDVVLVEDIIDTGATMARLITMLEARSPRSLTIVCLLDKPSRRTTECRVDIVGFEIPDRFVVGYGLDEDEQYRNLPSLVAKPSA